jgi:hypothetical protein
MQTPAAIDWYPVKNKTYIKIAVRNPEMSAQIKVFFNSCLEIGFIFNRCIIWRYGELYFFIGKVTTKSLAISIQYL